MNKRTVFKGCATALITPFDKYGEVDYPALARLIDYQAENGSDAVVICGTTGESSTLSDTERRRCIVFSIEHTNGRLPVIVGTGSNNGGYAKELSRFASSAGADGLLVVTPYYNKATDNGLIKYYLDIADVSLSPVILYNAPSRTGCRITMPIYKALAGHENIVGVKEASGDISLAAEIISELSDSLTLYSGCDELTLPILSLGGGGVISVLSNIVPYDVHMMCRKYFDGDTDGARKLQLRLIPLIKTLFSEVNPIPIKTACEKLGMCGGYMRSPLCEMNEENKNKLFSAMREYGLIK